MSDTNEATLLETQLRTLQQRLQVILDDLKDRPDTAHGIDTMLRGVEQVLQNLDTEHRNEHEETQITLLIQGVHGVLDLFSSYELSEVVDEEDTTPAIPQGLEQFIDGFRREAQKRLTGLSISMMGLFNTRADERAIDTSAQHLHAIRGGAAMLSLNHVSQIAGLMEQLLLSMRRVPADERTWPTQSLMRGYQMLDKAIQNAQVKLDDDEAQHVIDDLRSCFDDIAHLEEISTVQSLDEPTVTMSDEQKVVFFPRHPTQDIPALVPQSVPMEQRILIVDDVETIAASVGFVLSELDVPIDIANNGGQALTMLKQRPYSLVISDIAMPRMDGIALTSMIRQDAQLSNIPVILLTSLDHPSERDAGIDAGANDYIIKGSIGGGELVFRVQELLKIAPFVPVEAPKPKSIKKRVLVAEDAETVAASIAFVLSEGNLDIVLASDGMEALGRLERENFDLLISDWQMPSMSGIELIQAVRASTIVQQMPIILLTSLSTESHRQRAHDAGANAYLVKGDVAGGLLLNVVNRLLDEFEYD